VNRNRPTPRRSRKTTVVATASVPLDSNSLYQFIYKTKKKPGSYTVTAEYVPSDGDHLGNTATASFKVKR
jgi:hypothetical protein